MQGPMYKNLREDCGFPNWDLEKRDCLPIVLNKFPNSSTGRVAFWKDLVAMKQPCTAFLSFPLIILVPLWEAFVIRIQTCAPTPQQISISSVNPTESALQKKQCLQNISCSFFRIQREVTNPWYTIKMIKCKHYWACIINILYINMFSKVLFHFYCFSVWHYSILVHAMK